MRLFMIFCLWWNDVLQSLRSACSPQRLDYNPSFVDVSKRYHHHNIFELITIGFIWHTLKLYRCV